MMKIIVVECPGVSRDGVRPSEAGLPSEGDSALLGCRGRLTFSLLCGLGWLAYEVVSYTALARRTNRRIVERKNSDT